MTIPILVPGGVSFTIPLRVVLATHNEGKIAEMTRLLDAPGIELVTASELGLPDVEETGATFVENALLKAAAAAKASGLPSVADDSGMELEVLKGWPGVHSARCAGEGASDEARRALVLERMKGLENRRIRFVSVMALVRPAPEGSVPLRTWFTGVCDGIMTLEPQGAGKPGLPYDPIFYSPELGKTFGEATEEEKASVSHRGRSAAQMRRYLQLLAGKRRR